MTTRFQYDGGKVLLGHRYYDPSIGRFITQDPIGAGDNWYAYVENNPLADIDPEGLQGKNRGRGGKTNWQIPEERRKLLLEEIADWKKRGSKSNEEKKIKEYERIIDRDDKARGRRNERKRGGQGSGGGGGRGGGGGGGGGRLFGPFPGFIIAPKDFWDYGPTIMLQRLLYPGKRDDPGA